MPCVPPDTWVIWTAKPLKDKEAKVAVLIVVLQLLAKSILGINYPYAVKNSTISPELRPEINVMDVVDDSV